MMSFYDWELTLCLLWRWKLVKNTLEFIKKSKDFAYENEDDDQTPIEDILTEEMQQEILRDQGPEFDLYLKGLRYRNYNLLKK